MGGHSALKANFCYSTHRLLGWTQWLRRMSKNMIRCVGKRISSSSFADTTAVTNRRCIRALRSQGYFWREQINVKKALELTLAAQSFQITILKDVARQKSMFDMQVSSESRYAPSLSPGTDTVSTQSSKSGKSPRFHFVGFRLSWLIKIRF